MTKEERALWISHLTRDLVTQLLDTLDEGDLLTQVREKYDDPYAHCEPFIFSDNEPGPEDFWRTWAGGKTFDAPTEQKSLWKALWHE